MTDKHTLAPPELAERALVEELATQMALAAGYAPHCWPTWEQEATVIIPTIAKHMATRITALEAEKAELVEANQRLRNGYADAVSGYEYILQYHGRLNGVGFERVMDHFAQWVTIPEREDLVAGSHTLARATLAKHLEGEGDVR